MRGAEIEMDVVQVNAVPRKQFPIVTTINRCEGIKTENAGYNSLGFDVRQPTGRNTKFLASQPSGNLKAGVFNVTHRAAEAFPQNTKFVSSLEFHTAPLCTFFENVTKRAATFYFPKGRSEAFLFVLRNTRGGILAPNYGLGTLPVSGLDSCMGLLQRALQKNCLDFVNRS